MNSETIYFPSSYVIVHRVIILWSWPPVITVVQFLRCKLLTQELRSNVYGYGK